MALMSWLGRIALAAAPLALPAHARPAVWTFPPRANDGAALRAMFQNPAGWAKTRARIDGIGYPDHLLRHQFTDAELQAWLPMLNGWGIKLELMTGVIKEWGPTAELSFPKGAKTWDRLIADGARIDRISMDEPLAFTQHALHQDIGYAADQTARFVAFVRQRYPAMQIGDIESYPGTPSADLMEFLDRVQARLRGWHVRGLDFFRLDVDWMHFVAHDRLGQEGWPGVRAVENECHRRRMPFSLIYWAANFPSATTAGEATDATWEEAIMGQGAAYAATGATPDEMVVDSWVQLTIPAVPDTAPNTFTRSVVDFASRFAPGNAR